MERRVYAWMITRIGYYNQLIDYHTHFVGVIDAPMLAFGYWSLADNYGLHGHSLVGSRSNWLPVHASPSAPSAVWSLFTARSDRAPLPSLRYWQRLKKRALSSSDRKSTR